MLSSRGHRSAPNISMHLLMLSAAAEDSLAGHCISARLLARHRRSSLLAPKQARRAAAPGGGRRAHVQQALRRQRAHQLRGMRGRDRRQLRQQRGLRDACVRPPRSERLCFVGSTAGTSVPDTKMRQSCSELKGVLPSTCTSLVVLSPAILPQHIWLPAGVSADSMGLGSVTLT